MPTVLIKFHVGNGGEGFAFHPVGPPVPRMCDVIFMTCNTLSSPEALALDCGDFPSC